MRPLVHEPIHTTSSGMSVILVPGCSPMYSSARCMEARLFSFSTLAGSGTTPVMAATSSGLVPQVTMGGSLAASSFTSVSK